MGEPQRGAQRINLARFETAENKNKVHVGSCAQFAFRGAAVENNCKEILAKGSAGRLQKIIEHLSDLGWELRSFEWRGDGHEESGVVCLVNLATQ